MKKHYATANQIERARSLRVHSTEAEKKLWNHLRNRQIAGYKFRRQHTVNGFYLDFACEDLKLAIELDGGQHNDPVHGAHDTRRAAALHKSGWRILRFWNNEVMENIEGVLAVIAQALTQNPRCGF
ncbi:MAG: endonuclease domain-containing protein [Alphaproteobacteria bacterium]|jgi:very-short-patch-repair endonuclease